MKKLITAALVVMAGLAASASAQISANPGDLVLGFYATGGQGQNVNLEVDLGSVAQFSNLAAGQVLTLPKLAAADLVSTYGANWNSRTDLWWGVVGTAGRVATGPGGQPATTLWATRAQPALGTQSTPWTPASRNAQSNPSALIEALLAGAPGSLTGATATTNSASAAAINAGTAGSYTVQDTTQPGTSFGFFNPSIDNGTNIPASSYAASDLYEVQPAASAAKYLGTFGLSAGGSLIFTTTPSNFPAPNPGRLINLSVLTSVAIGENFTFGFVVGGTGTSGAKPLLMRAMGPSLTQLGVGGVLSDPRMAYYSGSTQIGSNDNWGGDATILATAAAVGAFPFASATSLDAAIALSNVASGNNSVIVSGAPGTSGTVIAELYDATPNASFTTATPRLINVSILKNVGSGITVGFVVGGSTSKNVLVRASGPAIAVAPFNVSGTITDPKMTLFGAGGVTLASNDDWGTPVGTGAATAAQISAAASAVGAFAFPAGSKDSALLANLAPGSYTVQVTASTGTTGVGLVEVYEAP